MRFFALSAFTALTFGLLSSAAPAPLLDAVVDADVLGLVVVDAFVDIKRGVVDADPCADGVTVKRGLIDVCVDLEVNLKRGGDEHKCLESVLDGVVSSIEPIVVKIESLTVVDITLELVIELLAEVKVILNLAIADVNALLELDIDVVLTSVTGTLLDVSAVAKLICSVLRIVLELLQLLLSLCVKIDITDLVCEIVDLLVQLLSCILELVGSLLIGLIAEVLSLIADLLPFILSLKVTALLEILCIKLL